MITIIAFLILLGVLVVIHEGGHFFVLRMCKVHVDRFSVGMGPVIYKKKDKKGIPTITLLARMLKDKGVREFVAAAKKLNSKKILSNYINEIKSELKIDNSQICLSGFSQGCMIALQTALKKKDQIKCVIGYSCLLYTSPSPRD